jgi:two-component system KDP operon response regulator KdpE
MKKILIVEDDAKIRTALAVRLKAAGYQPEVAETGFAGLLSVKSARPDLILSDIWLPQGIGFALAERLRELGLAGIPIIFITAGKQAGLRKAAKEVGAAGFFEKPYDPDALMKAVAGALTSRDSCPNSGASNLLNATAA